MKISCPMCNHPLQSPGAVEEVSIEYTTLSICSRCGFGLDLRWRGRGSALMKPVPDLIIVGQDDSLVSILSAALPKKIRVEGVSSPLDALGTYARALRSGKVIHTILITQTTSQLNWSEVALSLRSLEEGFQVTTPAPLWFFTSAQLSREEQAELHELDEIYWRPCVFGEECSALLESIPPLFDQM